MTEDGMVLRALLEKSGADPDFLRDTWIFLLQRRMEYPTTGLCGADRRERGGADASAQWLPKAAFGDATGHGGLEDPKAAPG